MAFKEDQFRKYSSRIYNATVYGEHATKKKLPRINVKIFREDFSITHHALGSLETFGYYEWLEIRDAIQKEKLEYKKPVEEELNALLNRMSQHIKVPSLPLKRRRKSTIEEGPSIRKG